MNYSWIEFHGAVTHFPVALILVGFLFEIGAPLFKKPEWRVVSFWCLTVGALGSIGALASGWLGAAGVYRDASLPQIVVTHRLFAFVTAITAIAHVAVRIVKKDKLEAGVAASALLLLLVATAAVSYTGFLGGQMVFGETESKPAATLPSTSQAASVTPGDPKLVSMGAKLFVSQRCLSCHTVGAEGGSRGPDLTHEGSDISDVNWHIEHIKDPAKMNPGSSMPPYSSLTQPQLAALAAYLVSLK
ncbi:MAG TPA: DUF2231 domain-containing protein [Capsulimonadaceae bacterium]|jgi:uncharacterized membrane protein